VRLLLRSHQRQPVAIGVEQERRLRHAAAASRIAGLARDLGGDAALDALDRVQVLQLVLFPTVSSPGPQAHVRVAAELALLHVAIRDPEPAHEPA
jgi:hypothetical protein